MHTNENQNPSDQLLDKSNRYLNLMKRLTTLAEENAILSRDFQEFPGSVALNCVNQAREMIELFARTGESKIVEFVQAEPKWEETESIETESDDRQSEAPETLEQAVFNIAISGILKFIQKRNLKRKARALMSLVRFPGFNSRNKIKLQGLIKTRIEKEAKLKASWSEKKESGNASVVDAFFAAELRDCESQYTQAEAEIIADEKKRVVRRRFLAGCILLCSSTYHCTSRIHPNYDILNDINDTAQSITIPLLPPLRRKHGRALTGLPALGSVVRAASRSCMLSALRALELPQLGPRSLIRT